MEGNMQEREISLIEIWHSIRKRIAMILVLGILFAGLTAVVSIFLIQPKYASKATLIVGRPESYQNGGQGIEYNDVLLNQKLVGTYGEIMKSQSVTRQVVANLKLDLSLAELSKKVDVKTVNNTEIISLTVTDTIPERAMDIANETAEIFMEEVREIMHVDNVQILDAAVLPQNPMSPDVFMNTLIGAFFGLMLGVAIALFKEFNDTRIKSVEEYKNNFDIPVIGIVPIK